MGVVYRGRFGGKDVAVKVIKTTRRREEEEEGEGYQGQRVGDERSRELVCRMAQVRGSK